MNLSDPNYFTESNFWKDKADAESALAAAYSPIKGAMYGYFGAFDGWLNLNGRGDDIYTIKGEEVPMWTDLVAPVVTVDGEGENGLAYHRDIAAQVEEFFK